MLTNIKIGSLEYLTADNLAAKHGFTTRFGGVSEGYLASMNIGTHRGDDPENVLKNYEILASAIDFDPKCLVLTHQTHTDIVRAVTREDWGTGLFRPAFPDCDALITNEPGTALVIFTADCTPVLLHDPVTGAVGAAHAGWRGTAAGIAAKTVRAMCSAYGCKAENIRAAIGPNIGQCCFETDRDVPDAMTAALGERVRPFIEERGSKYHLDLKKINELWLREAGITCIDISDECTACRTDRFWSHRRVGKNRGSQGAIIVCGEAEK